MSKFILYACPVGPLADQIEDYFEQSKQQCGENSAHAYMPHCTLTGFFEDEESAISVYVNAMESAIATFRSYIPKVPVRIEQISFRHDWHGLAIQAKWLRQMVACFAQIANSPTRLEALRLKSWLHLSLAYDFQPEHQAQLETLAKERIDISSSVWWELRFYERKRGNLWICHRRLPLDRKSSLEDLKASKTI